MLVEVVNDLTVRVVGDKEHNEMFRGKFVLVPNSVRRDIYFTMPMPSHAKFQNRPFTGKDLDQHG